GAVAGGAPRIGMPPGSAAAHTARARRRADRICARGARVVIVGVPVGAPLVADAGEVEEPERVGRRGVHARRPGEALRRRVAGPGQPPVVDTAARGLLPLGLRGQPRARPRRERACLLPRDADDRLARIVEAGLTPEGGRGHARAKALERQGKQVIHLEIGEPDFDTPEHIRDAAKRALDAGATHYGPSAGLPELREAIAKHITETRGVPVSAEQVVVTPGAKPIMFFTIMTLAGPGDEVIYPNPGFPIYESVINFVGAKAVPIPLRESSEFGFDLELFE